MGHILSTAGMVGEQTAWCEVLLSTSTLAFELVNVTYFLVFHDILDKCCQIIVKGDRQRDGYKHWFLIELREVNPANVNERYILFAGLVLENRAPDLRKDGIRYKNTYGQCSLLSLLSTYMLRQLDTRKTNP